VPYRERQDVAFYVAMARESGGPVLELGCGSGRILIPCARVGIEMWGLDSSEAMLTLCQQKLAREPAEVCEKVLLTSADMRDFSLPRSFRMVTIPFRAFQHLLDPPDQMACLECIHRSLEPGGRLVFDVFNPHLGMLSAEVPTAETPEPEFELADGRCVRRTFRTLARDYVRQVAEIEFAYSVRYPDGREERLAYSFPMRWFFRFEIEHLLARCRFRLEQLYPDFDRSPFGSIYPGDLIFVAARE
jgi:SAM-dependent methyltransferase